MALIRCKMCGGDMTLEAASAVATCEYCGSVQTVPMQDDEKKLVQFERANRLRYGCDFDKAAGLYEAIVADYRNEAEAYWGLVLCKYGIEYVDDPATGKKIPTCHRSSFDSVLEDDNYQQALENSEGMAARVYREEAKQIERLRKGILEVSGKEAPYDIFICYKETAAEGGRTKDSVIAQEIYDALTHKGYRVFFSRITLENKLGVDFEPYIFAALNSAKVMLAVGTDYDHYHAVWVKNEWSRFLQLMAQDKGKYLIPCYRDIEPEDLPVPFQRLQGQDMSKIGAMQDLLHGIEKLLPRQAETAAAPQPTAAGSALIMRGQYALEDGDWKQADEYFDRALDQNPQDGAAYLGKTLAQERCRTIDAFIQKRKDATADNHFVRAEMSPDDAHIRESVEKFSIRDYVSEEQIRQLYAFDRSYATQVAYRQKQQQEEQRYWQNHSTLSRAEKFATGELAEILRREKTALLAVFADRVKQAEADEAARQQEVQARYAQHIQEADRQAKLIYAAGAERREQEYQHLMHIAKTAEKIYDLEEAAKQLHRLQDYKDGKALAQTCRDRIAEIRAKQEAEQEQQRLLAKKRKKRIAIIAVSALLVIIAFAVVYFTVIVPMLAEENANRLASIREKYAPASQMISAGYDHTVGLNADGTVVAVGRNDGGQCDVQGWKNIVAIAAGNSHIVGLKADGTVVAVGRNDYGQCDVQGWKNIVAIAARNHHTVGLKADGTVVAVGDNDYGECDVESWTDIVAIAAGSFHTVGLKADGTVVAVGYDGYDQCDVQGWKNIVAISAGGNHTVGLKADGTLVAVGWNADGQSDVGSWKLFENYENLQEEREAEREAEAERRKAEEERLTPIREKYAPASQMISAGYMYTVGLKADGTVYAVGWNGNGQLNVQGLKNIVAIAAGSGHTVGLKADGTVVAVGYNDKGQCDVQDWTDIVTISAGGSHTVGLKANGTVVAVGWNDDGQCNVQGWTDIVAVATGGGHTVGLKADGTVYAVGWNDYGQCNVQGWTDIVAIAAGDYHTVGLKADGTVVAVGWNDDGQCNVQSWTDIVAIAGGYMHTVGLKADGTVLAVGLNDDGQCYVQGWTDIVAIAAGCEHTVGLKADGTLVAVGDNDYGRCDVGSWKLFDSIEDLQ